MTLTDEIRGFTEDAYSRLPAGFIQSFRNLIDSLAEQRLGVHAPRAGDAFPDFELPDHDGNVVRASSIWTQSNLVVKFYRGGWCPYCNLELASLQKFAPRLESANGQIVAIAPEKPEFQESTREAAKARFRFLWDADNALAARLGIAFPVSDDVRTVYGKLGLDLGAVNGTWFLPVPATFVVRDGIVRYRYVDPDYMKREDPLVLLSVLDAIEAGAKDAFAPTAGGAR